jgi:hypothetical protein
LDHGRREPVARRAARIVRRGYELGQVEYYYSQVVGVYHLLFHALAQNGLGRSEFIGKADRAALERLEAVLEGEIRPQEQAAREEFVALCGFDWRDRVRVVNPGLRAAELEPTELHFNPWEARPTCQLMGRALKRDGRPGERIIQTPLILGVSKVTVLTAAADCG